MTAQTVIDEVRTRLGMLNKEAEQAIQETLEVLMEQGVWRPGGKPRKFIAEPLQFVGENLSLEEYASLSFEEKGKLAQRLRDDNAQWLEKHHAELNAAWLAVIDGEIVDWSQNPDTYPQPPEIQHLCDQYGKFPFVFINPRELWIEEQGSVWSTTVHANDSYPTIKVRLSSGMGATHLTVDLDTGARNLFTDFDLLVTRGLIVATPTEIVESGRHLSQDYYFCVKSLTVSIQAGDGYPRQMSMYVYCIWNWSNSPFTSVNPHRQALLGRRLLLALQPTVHLDFKKRHTKVSF